MCGQGFNSGRFSGCGCGNMNMHGPWHMHGTEMYSPEQFRHWGCCDPVYPSKKEQVERLKEYKQKLQDELNEVENRLKDFE
ncbi:MAG: DUF5320 domain-containing protein [Actinobacteria bacterium]|nr:DUF5320 domain-containing protein [Actinomycetota bacterium]